MANALPLLVLAGGAALLLSKKSAKKNGGSKPENIPVTANYRFAVILSQKSCGNCDHASYVPGYLYCHKWESRVSPKKICDYWAGVGG